MKNPRRANLVAAAKSSSTQIHPGERAIRALRAASNHAIAARDLSAVSTTLVDDFVVIIGDGTLLTRAAYLEAFAQAFAQPIPLRYERIADAIDFSVALPLAAERGHWVGTQPDGTVLFTGTYMAMWRHSPSGWRLRSELFVTLT